VALDENGQVTSVPDIEFESDEERARFAEAAERQKLRLARNKEVSRQDAEDAKIKSP
jgi:hypothetical protein